MSKQRLNHCDCFVCDRLESRTFFSLSPAQAVAADKVKLTADESQLTLDRHGTSASIVADRSQLTTDARMELTAANNQLKVDQSSAATAIRTDQANGLATLKTDRAAVVADQKSAALDRMNPVAEQADLAKLASDRMLLGTDSINLKSTLAGDKSAWATVFSNDRTGITAVRKNSTSVLTADASKLTSDLKSRAGLLFADSKVIAADEVQLAKDQAILGLINLI